MKRRTVLHAMGALAAVGALSGAGLAPAMAQARKVLVIASNQDVPNFDPHIATGYSASAFLRNVYDSLVRVEGNPVKVVPSLAESWTVSPDGMEYTFKLSPAAKFTDGSPVTSADVKYSFDRLIRLAKGNAWMVAGIIDTNSVIPVDATTVKVKLVKPFAAFLQVLPWLWVVNAKEVEANKGSDDGQTYLRSNVAGSGAFRIKRAEPGNLYEFEKVANPWKTGGGNLTGAIWRIIRETSNQRLAVQRGEAHFALDLTAEDMDALKDKPGVVSVVEPEFRTFSIKMNTEYGPLADINLRKAISYAFDYKSMEESAGYQQLMVGPLPHGILGHDPNLPVPRTDLAKAKEYLAKSKSPNGGIKLTMVHVSGLEQQRRFALVLLDSLKKINIDLDIKPMVWPDMVASTASPDKMADFFPVYQTANYGDPDNIAFAAYHSSRNGNWQNPVYKSAKVDDLIMQGRAETDETKRKAIYLEFQKQVVDDAPDIFGVLEKRKLAIRSDVSGFVFTPVASNAIEFFPLSLK
ncbi:ABC transporter substrate-binding protein [Alsobacter sp. SYSU M60028]|uniref:ABC transporter substrate-binding protein n=1 Tax=Alsobacter ponti TaxID=2962936 RepID=A0ABT1LHN0_9HYPH|nr:ABC transporter substrate-binding protein [Alsobacter ponti]MCP8941017.1 ABC transporter substrate-binding protein [Alsobacter ponti]